MSIPPTLKISTLLIIALLTALHGHADAAIAAMVCWGYLWWAST